MIRILHGSNTSVEPRSPPEQPARSGKQGEHRDGEARDPSPAEAQLRHASHNPEADERRGGAADENPIEPGAAASGHARAFSGERGMNVRRVDAVARALSRR